MRPAKPKEELNEWIRLGIVEIEDTNRTAAKGMRREANSDRTA
jgi:hypothetical protein